MATVGKTMKTVHVTKKINHTSGKGNVKRLTTTAMLSAIAVILMYMEIPVPFMPGFIKLDISDLPALFGTCLLYTSVKQILALEKAGCDIIR